MGTGPIVRPMVSIKKASNMIPACIIIIHDSLVDDMILVCIIDDALVNDMILVCIIDDMICVCIIYAMKCVSLCVL